MKKAVLFTLLASSLVACQIPIHPAADIEWVNLKAEQVSAPTEIQVSQNPGAKIHLTFQYGNEAAAGDFKSQLFCSVTSDLESIRIYLIDGSTSFGNGVPLGLLPANISSLAIPNASTFYAVNKTITAAGQSQSITLSNVNTGSYYLAVAAYDGPNGTGNNISAALSALFSFSLIGGQRVVLTDGGGNASNPGRVEIGPAALGFPILNGTSPSLTVNLKLGLIC